jgi:Flp pilus assembly protein TadD
MRRSFSTLALLFLFLVVSGPAIRAQSHEKEKKRRESFVADKVQSNKETEEEEWSRSERPRDVAEWFARGYQMHNSGRYTEAIEAFMRAVALDYRMSTAMYNIACGYSLLNDKENALIWLQRALESGFDSTELVAEDSDLDPLRTDARFQKITAAVRSNDEPAKFRNAKHEAKLDRLEQANLNFARLQREASHDGEQWSKVGVSLLFLRELDRSVIALKNAVTYLDYQGSSAMYNLACAYALQGNRDAGIGWLEKSVNAGFDGPEKFRNDPDINNLRADPRFPAIDRLSNTLTLSQFKDKRDGVWHSDNSNYSKERWAPAIVLYESFLKTEPANGRGWFNLGYALHFSREHTRAVNAFKRAIELNYQKPNSTYNVACAYAMVNQKDLAFEWLERALKAGFYSTGDLNWDHDLDNLRSDARFKHFIESANYNSKLRSKD